MFKNERICPRCQTGRLKNWDELSGEEKFIFERLTPPEGFSMAERLNHLFCPRCHFEKIPAEEKV